LVDRSDVEVSLEGFGAARVIDHQVMAGTDLEAVNVLGNPTAVTPKKGSSASTTDRVLTARLPPLSYQMIRLSHA
jgi:alpha-L-arabinofuranosidase